MENMFNYDCNQIESKCILFTKEWDNPTKLNDINQYKIFLSKIIKIETAIAKLKEDVKVMEEEVLSQFKQFIKKDLNR